MHPFSSLSSAKATHRGVLAALLLGLLWVPAADAANKSAPLVCSRGSSGSRFNAVVTMPTTESVGGRFTVRIDSVPSGKIDHFGLKYIHDMATDFLVPTGAHYVDGSARIVEGTGTENVRRDAKVWYDKETIHFLLPAHVENGSSYTPPSIAFDLTVAADAGSELALKLTRYEVKAKAVIVGEVVTRCVPKPNPYVIGTVAIEAAH